MVRIKVDERIETPGETVTTALCRQPHNGEIDCLHDERIPAAVRKALQGCSFEAEILDCLGFFPSDGTLGGARFAELYRNVEQLTRLALPHIYCGTPGHVEIRGRHSAVVARQGVTDEELAVFLLFLGGATVGITCIAAGCLAWLL